MVKYQHFDTLARMGYRKDIQILRGVAVLLVVLFHLSAFKSGFLGVDVFFVISGYLMAVMYTPGSDFIARRARRLLPAYFATIAATLLVAALVTTPNDYRQVAEQSLFATAFVPNVGFWLQESYFDKSAFKPLLHLWSLGVEIQFYLLVPVLAWTINRWRASFWLILIGSALFCFAVVEVSPKTSFFWMPLRLWEFLLGFGVARYYQGPRRGWIGLLAAIALLCIPLLPVDAANHPGAIAALICLATAAVLAFGMPARVEAIGTPLEMLGSASYSVYLAHFPVITLLAYEPFEGTRLEARPLVYAVVIIASLMLYKLVERPFRKRAAWIPFAALSIPALCAAGFAVQRLTVPAEQMPIYQALEDRGPYRCGKLNRLLNPLADYCVLTNVENPTGRVLLAGNSFADSIKSTFASAAEAQGVEVLFPVDPDTLEPIADAIVLHYSASGIDSAKIERLVSSGPRVSLIMPVPTWEDSVPKLLARGERPKRTLSDYQKAHEPILSQLRAIQGLEIYEPAEILCDPQCAVLSENGKPLYFDHGHLTLTGSETLRPLFDEILRSVVTKNAPATSSPIVDKIRIVERRQRNVRRARADDPALSR